MKSYKIKITFIDGTYKYIHATEKKLRRNNVIIYVFAKYPKDTVKEIKTKRTPAKGWDLNYNLFFERAKDQGLKVEATNAPEYGDYTGYGARTEGRKNRFYIGRSTGWVPIYLEILTNRSIGGAALSTYKRTFSIVY